MLGMKKLLILFVVIVLLTACGEKHIVHTFYGDFDLDTMEVAYTRDSLDWYLVRCSEKDSFYWCGEWKYIHGPIKDYYCPDSNLYEESCPDNQGRITMSRIDPYHQYDWLK